MVTYSRPQQYARIFAWVYFLQALGAPYANVVVYVAAAPITAAVRLFYFGTYLPHLPPPLVVGAGADKKEEEEEADARVRLGAGGDGIAEKKRKNKAASSAPAAAQPPPLWRRVLLGPKRDGSVEMAWQLSHSTSAPPLVAFFSCLNFGYHWEHHRFPYAPWFDLPRVRALALEHGLRERCADAYLRRAAEAEVREQQRQGRRRGMGEEVGAAGAAAARP